MDEPGAILKNLNKQQLQAVTETEGYIRVIAGAGSGKTRALTSRFAYIVNELGINASNVLCVTFTNKAAIEMRNRVKKMIGNDYDLSYITTYHGFCVRVLREDIHKVQYPRNFIILDTEDQKAILRDVYEELKLDSRNFTFKQALNYIANRKYLLDYIPCLLTGEERTSTNDLEKIFFKYLEKQLRNYALDYDDLVNFTLFIYLNHPDVLEKWQQRMHYIQVDEMQDSSEEQYRLLKLLSNLHQNLFVVGDPDQTIYEWRGARPEILVHFDEDFKDTQTIVMDRNYRSTSKILDLGNNIIQNNKLRVQKDMFTQVQGGVDVVHFHAQNEMEEGFWIANEIKRLRKEEKASFSDIAVFYRANYISRNVEQALIQCSIPYNIFGGIRFFERKEIKDILSYMRLVESGDNLSFLRVINSPLRGLGKKFVEKLKETAALQKTGYFEALEFNLDRPEFARPGAIAFVKLIRKFRIRKNELKVSDLIKELLNESGLTEVLRRDGDAERLENITELINSVVILENSDKEPLSLQDYLQSIALYTDMDLNKEENDKVKLMTIHVAKGLEFPHVFLCGFNDGVLPNATSIKERGLRALEEERRLVYVAVTRAEKSFYMTESEGFNTRTGLNKMPSRFIFEINENLYVRKGIMNPEILKEAREQLNIRIDDFASRKRFKFGDTVVHPVWETGKVVEIDENKGEYRIEFSKINKIKPITFTFNGWVK
ncbi:MAG: UvrD-helicase domain-containing protein [Dysgonamonadaceae bacterium]|jgi:DNA helicase-2/ATP-dependent DNA helicase PcrA|nr:UvrD-helicase domain-containing protein [Dysgonamonadaceae bacterium]